MAAVSWLSSNPEAVYRSGRRAVIESHVGHSTPSRELMAVRKLPAGSSSYVSNRVSTSFLVNLFTPES
jgi:hypothetical protein